VSKYSPRTKKLTLKGHKKNHFNGFMMFYSKYNIGLLLGYLSISFLYGNSPNWGGVDAVIQKENQIHLFNYTKWTHKALYLNQTNGNAKTATVIESKWEHLVRPHYRFAPKQIVHGQTNNYLVWESEGQRIWQLDSGLQILSSIALPEDFKEKAMQDIQFSYGKDHKFNFINLQNGKVKQYIESGGKLQFYREIKIPIGFQRCMPIKWNHKSTLSEYPYLCVNQSRWELYSLFFIRGPFIEIKTDKPFSKEKDWQNLNPIPHVGNPSSIELIYNLGQNQYCYNVEKSQFYFCSP